MTQPIQLEAILASLVCPVCHSPLTLRGNKILCTNCRRIYPIEDGIPVLIPERAQLP